MLKKTQIAVLIYLIATLQFIGNGWTMWAQSSRFARFLLSETNLSPHFCTQLSQGTVALMGIAVFWVFFKWSPIPFLILGLVLWVEALSATFLGGEFAARYALGAEAARYFWLFAIAYAVEKRLDNDDASSIVPRLLQVALALTFFTHGFEALLRNSAFLHVVIDSSQKLVPLNAVQAARVLFVIGLIDIFCALSLLWKPRRALLSSLIVWGLATALARIAIDPHVGIFEALARAPHAGLPLLIMLLEGPKVSERSRNFFVTRVLQRSRIS